MVNIPFMPMLGANIDQHETEKISPKGRLWPANRIPIADNLPDQRGHGEMRLLIVSFARSILMRAGSIKENIHDVAFRKDIVIIEGQQQRFTNRQRSHPGIRISIIHIRPLKE